MLIRFLAGLAVLIFGQLVLAQDVAPESSGDIGDLLVPSLVAGLVLIVVLAAIQKFRK